MPVFNNLFRSLQAWDIAHHIKATRPDLRHLPAERVIRLYFCEERELDRAEGPQRPLSPLYRRVLLYEATQDMAFYFREYMRLVHETSKLTDEVADLTVENVDYQRVARKALSLATGAVDRLDNAGLDLQGKVNRN